MSLLTNEQIQELVRTIIDLGIDYGSTRPAFLSGINRRYVASMQQGLPAAPQLLTDLTRIRDQGRLADGQVPLSIWLANADLLVGAADMANVIKRRLEEVERQLSGAPRIAMADLPEAKELIVHQDDMVPHSFVASCLSTARSVAKLLVSRHENGQKRLLPNGDPVIHLGTGWLIKPDLLVTNHHVVNARGDGEAPAAEPDLRLQASTMVAKFDFDGEEQAGTDLGAVELVAYDAALDYAVLRLPPTGRPGLTCASESVAVVPGSDKYMAVNIIQHPEGRSKRVAMRNNLVTASNDTTLRYFTDTKPGSSGSPVCNDSWQVVALHRGATLAENVSYQGKKVAWVNVGTHMQVILKDLRTRYQALWGEIQQP